jgi:hypothetical protein
VQQQWRACGWRAYWLRVERREPGWLVWLVQTHKYQTSDLLQTHKLFKRNREVKIRLMNEGRCDERLKARVEESTCLTYTGLHDKTN